MFNSFRSLALSAIVGLGAAAAAVPAAQAEGIYVDIGRYGDVRAGVMAEYDGPDRDRYEDYDGYQDVRDHRQGDRNWRHRSQRRCSANDAVEAARDLGIRRARVVSTGNRTVEVRGRYRGDRVTVVFARQGNCRVLGWR